MEYNADNRTGSILWVTGDEEIMCYVYRQFDFGYWTCVFDILLEKRGWLGFDKAPSEILGHPENLEPYDFLIVSWLPDSFWKPAYLDTIKSFRGPVFVEGPFPEKVAHSLGLSPRIDLAPQTRGQMFVSDSRLRNLLKEYRVNGSLLFPCSEEDPRDAVPIFPKQVYTLATEPARQELALAANYQLEKRIHDTALSYLIAYKNRFQRYGLFFQDTKLNSLALLAWLKALEKSDSEVTKRRYEKFVRDGLNTYTAPISVETANDIEEVAVFGCALAMGARVLSEPNFAKESRVLLNHVFRAVKGLKNTPLLTRAWTLAFAAAHGKKKQLSPQTQQFIDREIQKFEFFLNKTGTIPAPILLWTLAFVSQHLNFSHLIDSLQDALTKRIKTSTRVEDGQLPAELGNRYLWEVLLVVGAAALVGLDRNASTLLTVCLDQAFDTEEGFYRQAMVREGRFELEPGYQSGPWAALGILSVVKALHIPDHSQTILDYEAEQLKAWAEPPYQIVPYKADGCTILAYFVLNGEKCPGLFQKGNVIGSTFQLLSYLVHYYTLPPLAEALLDCPSSHALLLENLLFDLIDQQAAQYDTPLLKVAPWPWGKKYCLTVRHDVDRIPDEDTFGRLIVFARERGFRVSWYWIPGRVDKSLLRRAEEAGYENGLHAMRLGQKLEEKKEIESHLGKQSRIYGENWHGGGGGDYWIGQPSVKAAMEAGMHYTELMPTIYDFPYSAFPALDRQGHVYCDRIVGLTHTCSVDAGTRKSIGIYKLEWMLELAKCGYYCMLLNHPDANFEKFRSWIEALPEEGRLDWTCAEVAKWWIATHQRERLAISKVLSGAERLVFELLSKDKVEDLELRLPLKDRCISSVEIDSGGGSEPTSWCYGLNSQLPELRIKVNLSPNTPKSIIVRKHPLL